MERLIIDTDPGIDDAQAIMMACVHPNVTVEALTIVAGNVGLDRTVANACTILDIMGSGARVYPSVEPGAARPGYPVGVAEGGQLEPSAGN